MSNCLNLRSNFYNVTHDPSKPVTDFINTIQSISHQLAAIKHPLHDTKITDMILLRLHESFSPVQSALITRKEEAKLNEIIAALKEHEAHMVMTNGLPKGTSGSDGITDEQAYFAGKQQKQGGARRLASKMEIDWGNSQGRDGVCFCCGRAGDVAAKCIADMPQEVKDNIVSGAGLMAKENETHLADEVAEMAAFARDNPHMFVLMANTLRSAHDHQYQSTIMQNLTEYAHIAGNHLSSPSPNPDIQWEPSRLREWSINDAILL